MLVELTSLHMGALQIGSSTRIYQPLDKGRREIRLLLVSAGADSDPLCCQLQQAFLSDEPKPKYETISYCWHDQTDRVEIVLNGSARMIPRSSKEAVRRMRKRDSDRILWIDAICINQEDPLERGHQIGLMYDIYTHTRRNLIWLGDEDSTTASAFDAMKIVLENARSETQNFKNFAATTQGPDSAWPSSSTGLDCKFDMISLLKLYDRAWFRRLW